jgi:hypothetical protein
VEHRIPTADALPCGPQMPALEQSSLRSSSPHRFASLSKETHLDRFGGTEVEHSAAGNGMMVS